MRNIPKAYNPKETEDRIYEKWEKSGYFNPDNLDLSGLGLSRPKQGQDGPKKTDYFSIAMPPPNRTGTLHTGHAIMLAYQDIMVRYNRLLGKKTLWLPGTDHAAIATQTKVEKLLYEEEKKTRHDLGKEKFLKKVTEFAEESKNIINNQVRKMGSSCDWSRERYTLDEGLNQVVKHAFSKMYEAGVIYRGYRIVNWCPHCLSTLSDDEVEYKETTAKFYTFKYAKDFPIAISTTRPETKLGDSAVAVNPKDKRYQKYIGQSFTINLGHGPQEIKIVGEDEVDPEFGTGALGVTPAHSMIDYEIAQKNDLPVIKVIGEDGKMTAEAGKDYQGLNVIEARDKFVKWLNKQGLITKQEEISQNLSICYRCATPIEPLLSKQWWIDVNKKITLANNKYFKNKSIKEVALGVVKNKEIKIIPDRFVKDYYRWLENLRDWCISRQIWFGHQIPVWYKKADKGIELTFIRHGQSEGNKAGIVSQNNEKLTDEGREQVRLLKQKININEFDVIFSSDLVRTKETADILFGELKDKIITDKRLREINFGDLIGEKGDEINKYRMTGYSNGETYQQLRDRILDFLSELINKYDGKKIAIVGHSGVWKVLEILFHNAAFDQEHLQIHATREPVKYNIENLSYVGIESPKGKGWVQDKDTLDTWFSSGLWTFSTLMDKNFTQYDSWEDWVAGSKDLEFHPTSVMETGYDILFFWVARMIIQTTFMLGEIPFKTVYLHGLVRDEQGRKMSKSLGNVVDPLDLIAQYGTDALRLAMITGTAPGADTRLYDEKVEGYRNFVNKLWNISRYILTSVDKIERVKEKPQAKTLADKWVLAKFDITTDIVIQSLNNFNFSIASESLRSFTWEVFADWYLEIAKIEKDKDKILLYILERLLILWHPFIPFVTEEIWSNLDNELLMVQKFPDKAGAKEKDEFNIIIDTISAIRTLRSEYKIEPVKRVNTVINAGKNFDLINSQAEIIKGLARIESLEVVKKADKPAKSLAIVVAGIEIYILTEGLLDFNKEKNRLQKEIDQINNFIKGLKKKLDNKEFVKNAPKEVVAKEEFKLNDQKEKLEKLKEQLKHLQ